jgi:hypothetical protein
MVVQVDCGQVDVHLESPGATGLFDLADESDSAVPEIRDQMPRPRRTRSALITPDLCGNVPALYWTVIFLPDNVLSAI